MAAELGVELEVVQGALTAAGVIRRGRAPKYPRLREPGWLETRLAAGRSLRSIAEEVGCSVTAVRAAANRLGLPRRAPGAWTFPLLHDAAWLRRRYVGELGSSGDIAAEVGCDPGSVLRALRAAGVPIRPGRSDRRYPELYDRSWLRRRYLVEKASTRQIAAELGCSTTTVNKALQRANIPVRGGRTFPRLRSRAWLRRVYVVDGSTIEQIAAEVGCRPASVRRALHDAGITRPRRVAHRTGSWPVVEAAATVSGIDAAQRTR